MEDKKYITVNNKNIGLRILLFLLAFAIAIGAFAYSCSNINKKEPGFYTLDAANADLDYYCDDITFKYYIDGESDSIKDKLNTLNNLYKEILKKSYEELSSVNYDYFTYKGIGYLNTHLNEDITVSGALYNILKEAYEKTLENNNYNMFAGLLYNYWDVIFMSSESKELDPSVDTVSETRINELVALCNDLSNFDLQFKEDDIVCFNISNTLKDYIENNSYTDSLSIIDLNVLTNAYIVDSVAKAFIEKNYIDGYIYSNDGYGIVLSDKYEITYNQTDYSNKNIITVGSFANSKKISYSQFSRFQAYNGKYFDRYYIVNGIMRNYYLDLSTGLQNQLLNRFVVYSDNLVDSAYINNQINAIKTKDELDAFLLSLDSKYHYVYTLNNDEKVIYMDSYLKDKFTLNEDSNYTVE